MSEEKYQLENDILANDMLKRNFYYYFINGNKNLGIILLNGSHCQNCYCTVKCADFNAKFINNDIILNYGSLLDWYIEKQFKCNIKLCGDGIFEDTNFNQIANITINKFSNSLVKPKEIIIDDSLNWISNNVISTQVQDFIKSLSDLGISARINIYFNGKYCSDRNDCEEIINFAKQYNYPIYAEINRDNVNNWKQNIDWFKDNYDLIKLHIDIAKDKKNLKDIDKTVFIEFLDYLTDIDNENNLPLVVTDNETFNRFYQFKANDFINGNDLIDCDFGTTLFIDCSNLNSVLCPGLCHEEFIIGTYKIVDSKISDFKSNIAELFVVKNHMKWGCIAHCESCPYIGICSRFCLANSYEQYTDMLIPAKTVCEFHEVIYDFIIKKYKDRLFSFSRNNPEYKTYFYQLIESVAEDLRNHKTDTSNFEGALWKL